MNPTSTISPTPSINASAEAAASLAAFYELLGVYSQIQSQETGQYFAAAVCGAIGLFAISFWTRFFFIRYASSGLKESKILKAPISISRLLRHYLSRPCPGFTSLGHALLVVLYLIINLIFATTNTLYVPNDLVPIANRMGWLALLNLVLVIFLALKNTPLALLTANSYESLNQLHQACGYTTALCAALHATFQSIAWTRRIKYPGFIVDTQQKFGMVALACFWIIVISALTIRRFKYEVFYVIHLTMIVLALVSIGIHRTSSVNKAIIVTIFAAGIWGIDRGFRTLRTLSNSKGTTATICPLPNRATRVVLDRSLSSAVPGTHCYLWIPKIRLLETHPFTIMSNIRTSSSSSLEFVIAAHDGFTSDLYEYASKNPGTSLRASMDGPYGIPANFGTVADKVVFLSGGSGASYTFGVALDMIKKIPISGITGPSIDFVWTVGEAESFSWFGKEIVELQRDPHVSLFLHATHTTSSDNLSFTPPISKEKEDTGPPSASSLSAQVEQSQEEVDLENNSQFSTLPSTSLNIKHERPNIVTLITNAVDKVNKKERIVIVACGPPAMMKTVRRTTADCISVNGPSVELHCEEFGW